MASAGKNKHSPLIGKEQRYSVKWFTATQHWAKKGSKYPAKPKEGANFPANAGTALPKCGCAHSLTHTSRESCSGRATSFKSRQFLQNQTRKKVYQEKEAAFTDAEGMEIFGNPNFIGNKVCLNQRYFPHSSHIQNP